MRYLSYILTLGCLLLGAISPSYAQDYTRLSERTIMGTARYVGMGGAMSAIGGDPSAVLDNTAGLGLYRRIETLVSFDFNGRFMAPHASVVFSLPVDNPDENSGTQYHNFMISFNRVHSFHRSLQGTAPSDYSLGALFAGTGVDMGIPYTTATFNDGSSMRVEERGYVNEYAFDWAMNISNRWYWGLGLRVNSFNFSSDADYIEDFAYINASGKNYYNRSRTSVMMSGAGCSLSTGVLLRPLSWLRIGFGFQTPSFSSLTLTTGGTFDAMTDTLRWSDAPDLVSRLSDFHMPLHTSTSIAFQIKHYALIALQHDFRYIKGVPAVHSFRAGLEVVPVTGLYINAGYAFESAFDKPKMIAIDPTLDRQDAYFVHNQWQQYISGGVGFRGKYLIAQLAYQYNMHRSRLYAHEYAMPYRVNMNTHRVVLTLGWHHD